MATITISREFGSGGRTLAQRLCDRFGFHLVDEFAIDELANQAKVKGDWLKAVEKEATSTILNVISTIVSSGRFYKNPSSPGQDYERKKYIEFLSKIMNAMADHGDYVILGRGSQFVLSRHPRAFHIFLVADYEDRLRFILQHYDVSNEEAAKMIREKEAQRAAVATKIFGADINDPKLYHVVFNVSRLPFEYAVEEAASLVERFFKVCPKG
jgi:cytidylate kinase